MACPAHGLVPEKTVDAIFSETLLPTPDRRAAGTRALGDFENWKSVSRVKNDARPLNMFQRAAAVTDDRSEALAVVACEEHARSRQTRMPCRRCESLECVSALGATGED